MTETDYQVATKLKEYNSRITTSRIQKFELAAIDDFLFWSRKTWCQFVYVYRDNALNRSLGRAGQSTDVRFGTRNLDLIPVNKRPKTRNPSVRNIRYFDTGKFGGSIRAANGKYKTADGGVVNGLWRSCGYDKVIVLLKIWSFVQNKFVTNFDEFFDTTQTSG